MQRKAFVLLSGGLDSTTCLFKAIYDYFPKDNPDKDLLPEILHCKYHPEDMNWRAGLPPIDWVEAVSIDYGQRHKKELDYAAHTCDVLGIKHTILDVGNLLSGKTVLLSAESVGTMNVPDISYSEIHGVSPSYVPFRNGLMLSALTAHTQKYVNDEIADKAAEFEDQSQESVAMSHPVSMEIATVQAKDLCGVYFGAHSDDAQNWAYPDCTPEFIGAMANAIYIGSYMCIRLHTPLEWLTKGETVTMGTKMEVPYKDTWSCYKGEELHCGTCPTCLSRKEAFHEAGVKDPTEYAMPDTPPASPVYGEEIPF